MEGGTRAEPGDALARATVAVQAVRIETAGRARVHDCTGVLVAPDLVLTAAHCTDEAKRPSEMAVFPFNGAAVEGGHVGVVRIVRHPRHRALSRGHPEAATRQAELAADLALLRLAAPLRDRRPVAMAAASSAPPPSRLAAAGTGAAGRGAGVLRLSAVTALRFTRTGPRLAFASAGGARVCYGDSGGPVAATTPDGPKLWGLAGAIFRSEGGCAGRMVIVPVDPDSADIRAMFASARAPL
jgi:hypothetical protein